MAQQLSMLELAKQGNAEAIAALINRSLLPKGITAEASLQNDRLEVALQSLQVPNQKAVVALIRKGMETLQTEAVKKVRVLSFRGGNGMMAWEAEFELAIDASATTQPNQNIDLNNPREPLEIESTQRSPASQSDRQSMILANANPLAQLKQRFQEYQDIIIRFIDASGAVRCLATLTELLQIITRSKFSFTDLASSPSLRSLLDAIAEFSYTDRDGNLILSNISILQPGQSWQKAKIRLVTKVLFEAEEYDAPSASPSQGAIEIEVLNIMEGQPEDRPTEEMAGESPSGNLERSPQPVESHPTTEPDRPVRETIPEPLADSKDESKDNSDRTDDTLDSWISDLDTTNSPQSDAPTRQVAIASRTVSPLLDDSGISSPLSYQRATPEEKHVAPASSNPEESSRASSSQPELPTPIARSIARSHDRGATMTLDDLTELSEFGDVKGESSTAKSVKRADPNEGQPETLDDFSAMW
jgi:hypothetical protein